MRKSFSQEEQKKMDLLIPKSFFKKSNEDFFKNLEKSISKPWQLTRKMKKFQRFSFKQNGKSPLQGKDLLPILQELLRIPFDGQVEASNLLKKLNK